VGITKNDLIASRQMNTIKNVKQNANSYLEIVELNLSYPNRAFRGKLVVNVLF